MIITVLRFLDPISSMELHGSEVKLKEKGFTVLESVLNLNYSKQRSQPRSERHGALLSSVQAYT